MVQPNFSDGVLQQALRPKRYYTPNWSLSDAKLERISPERGRVIRAISMGLSDESGGCQLISADIPGAYAQEGGSVFIGPHSPFVGNLVQPFVIKPTAQLPDAIYGAENLHNLDLLLWYDELPTVPFPLRGPIIKWGTYDDNTTQDPIVFINGRKRVMVYGLVSAVESGTVSLSVSLDYPVATDIGSFYVYNSTTLAAGETFAIELDGSNRPPTVTGQDSANSWVPTMGYQLSLHASADDAFAVQWRVEARDY